MVGARISLSILFVLAETTESLQSLLHKLHKKLIKIPGDGFCFKQAVRQCLSAEYGKHYPLFVLQNLIMNEIMDHPEIYDGGHVIDREQPMSLLECITDFFLNRVYD